MATHAENMVSRPGHVAAEVDELVQRARALVPMLRDVGPEGDRDSRLVDTAVEGMLDAGILQMMGPRRFGGSEAGAHAFLEVASILGEGDGAAAWVFGILGCHHLILAHFPVEAQEEVYGAKDHALFPLTYSGKGGTARRVDGGYRISGDWSFATGIDFSDWVGALATVEGQEGVALNFLLPKRNIEVIDDWKVAGMRGTGSRRFVVRDQFVPEHRTLAQSDLLTGRTPGARAAPAMDSLRLPLHSMLLVPTLGAIFGLARRAIDEFVDLTKSRIGYGGIDHAARTMTQCKISDAMARLDAVHCLVERNFIQLDGYTRERRKASREERLRYRRDATLGAATCVEIVDMLVGAAGASSQHQSSPFQLIQRDIHTAGTHVLLDRDDANELYGKQILGIDLGEVRY